MKDKENYDSLIEHYKKEKKRLLNSPVLHTAAEIPTIDFLDICERIKNAKEEPEHYDTNLPYFFSENRFDIEALQEHQNEYPHIFEKDSRGGLYRSGFDRWQLSWLGRSFFKEYPYRVDIELEAGKTLSRIESLIECNYQTETATGIPIWIFGYATATIEKWYRICVSEYYVSDIEEDWSTDFEFKDVTIETEPVCQLKNGQEVKDGKAYTVNFQVDVSSDFYEPYGEIELKNGFLGLDGTLRSR